MPKKPVVLTEAARSYTLPYTLYSTKAYAVFIALIALIPLYILTGILLYPTRQWGVAGVYALFSAIFIWWFLRAWLQSVTLLDDRLMCRRFRRTEVPYATIAQVAVELRYPARLLIRHSDSPSTLVIDLEAIRGRDRFILLDCIMRHSRGAVVDNMIRRILAALRGDTITPSTAQRPSATEPAWRKRASRR